MKSKKKLSGLSNFRKHSIVKKKFFLILFLVYFTSFAALAQQQAISGTVTDTNSQPLPGVTVVVKGTTQGTVTNTLGNYTISNIPEDATLVFSFVGMQVQEVFVGNQTSISVTMQEETIGIEEVVAIGYGTREKGRLTGSIANIGGEELANTPTPDMFRTLQGKLPGLSISDRGGEPGKPGNVNYLIRGKATLGNNTPLIVINGIPRGETSLSELNPEDIESVSVLKDASAAIYGAQAANGVILVQTKSGAAGKAEIRLNSSSGVSFLSRTPELMSSYQFGIYRNEMDGYLGRSPSYSQEDLEKFRSGSHPLTHPNTNWHSNMYKDYAPHTRHGLTATGGTEGVQYFLSGEYLHQGMQYRSGDMYYDRFQLRSNVTAKVAEFLEVGVDIMGRIRYQHGPRMRSWYEVTQAHPYVAGYYPNGLPGYGIAGINHAVMTSEKAGWDDDNRREFESKLTFDLDMTWLIDGLRLKGYASYDFDFYMDEFFRNPYYVYQYNEVLNEYIRYEGYEPFRSLSQTTSFNKSELYNISLNYDKTFGDHNFTAFVAYEQVKGYNESLSAYRRDLVSEKIVELFSGGTDQWTNNGYSSEYGRLHYFGSIGYDYMRKYLIDLTLRRDGSYNFAQKGRFGTFPSVSVGWTISKEPFMASATDRWLDNLKLRTSYGIMGNDRVASFQYMLKYAIGGYHLFGDPAQRYDGFYQSNVPNPNITWEKAKVFNAGVDAFLLDNKLSLTFDYFYEKRRDILITRNASVPDYTGLSLPQENLGKVDNRGFEWQINFNNTIGSFTYTIGGNMGYNKNKVVYMDEAPNVLEWQKREGYPIDSWLTYKTDGIFNTQEELDEWKTTQAIYPGQSLGDIKIYDLDGDGAITSADRYRKYTSKTPQIQYGINTGLAFKGLRLEAFWVGQAKTEGYFRYNGIVTNFNVPTYLFERRWTPENPTADYPRAWAGPFNVNRLQTDFWIYDLSFIALEHATLSYDLPSTWVSKIKFDGIQLYFKGSNLWTIWDGLSAATGQKNYSPELNTGSGANNPDQYYPQQTILTLGLQVSF